jgi:uncharacterized protein (TIGR00251 family)
MTAGWLKATDGGTAVSVRVSTRSSKASIEPEKNGRLQLRVTAAPEDGKANTAACKLVAKALHIGATSVEVTAGPASREKTISIDGLGPEAVEAALLAKIKPR